MTFTFWPTKTPQVPLEFLTSANYWKAGIVRNSIINAVGNLKTTETNSRKSFRAGKQNATQAKNTTAFHRAQIQRLAALANKHTQLCYEFDHHELIDHRLGWQEDPTCRRALKGCLAQLLLLRFTTAHVHPLASHPPVMALVHQWCTPGFTCTISDFHLWL